LIQPERLKACLKIETSLAALQEFEPTRLQSIPAIIIHNDFFVIINVCSA